MKHSVCYTELGEIMLHIQHCNYNEKSVCYTELGEIILHIQHCSHSETFSLLYWAREKLFYIFNTVATVKHSVCYTELGKNDFTYSTL